MRSGAIRRQNGYSGIYDMPNDSGFSKQHWINEDQAVVVRESLRIRFSQTARGIVPMTIMVLILGVLLWSACPPARLLAWLSASYTCVVLTSIDCRRKFKLLDSESNETILRLSSRLQALLLTNGIAVGSGMWLVAAVSPYEVKLLVTAMLCFYSVATLANLSTDEKTYFAVMFTSLGQVIAYWLTLGSSGVGIVIALAVACISYFLFTFARQNAKVFAESIRMRYENRYLLDALSAEKKEVERALAIAEEANLAKSRFLAAASHDLRQPLHALGLWADLLRGSLTSPIAIERADKMLLSVESLDKMFSGLLDLSRLDSGNVNPDRKKVSLQKIFTELNNNFHDEALAKGIELNISNISAWVFTDPIWLERILHNLVANAIKYTQHGAVTILCEESGDSVHIIVRDTGIGIKHEELDRIFEEYYQLDNSARDRTLGVGLGLAIVKRACKLLDLPISVKSKPGVGSDFAITICKCESEVEPDGDAAQARGDNRALDGLVVVLVEDDKEVAEVMRVILPEWNCVPVICENAAEAVALLSSRDLTPQVIISDYRLRNSLTGIEVIEMLRTKYGPLPAALITGEVNIVGLTNNELRDYVVLQKPVSPAQIKYLLVTLQMARQ